MTSTVDITSSFIDGAPPGELSNVVEDIKTLTSDSEPSLISKLKPAFEKYNEEQLTTAKLPGSSQPVLISKYNKLPDGRYYDAESSTSFEFDHISQVSDTAYIVIFLTSFGVQKASSSQSYTHDSPHSALITSLLKSLSTYFAEHYPPSSASAYSISSSSDTLTILLVANKYSPTNFWNGRWRATFQYDPSTEALTGEIKVNVHYYEDGNVALKTTKPVSVDGVSESGAEIMRRIAQVERSYQEELNRSFVALSEGSFKGLRRQLPVTRQKVEWEKVGGYRLGADLRGGAQR